jgi:hypothetical protein
VPRDARADVRVDQVHAEVLEELAVERTAARGVVLAGGDEAELGASRRGHSRLRASDGDPG